MVMSHVLQYKTVLQYFTMESYVELEHVSGELSANHPVSYII